MLPYIWFDNDNEDDEDGDDVFSKILNIMMKKSQGMRQIYIGYQRSCTLPISACR